MANIKVISERPLFDGMAITFNAPCKCNEVLGLTVSYFSDSKSFTFRDAHGNDLTGLGNLFEEGAYVKAILDTTNGYAYLQNADTNAYLEAQLAEKGVEDSTYSGCFYRMISGAKEWLNPPMELGEEYRTTERCEGKPVYVKRVDLGTLPDSSHKSVVHGLSKITFIATETIARATSSTIVQPFPFFSNSGSLQAKIHLTNDAVNVYTFGAVSGYTAVTTLRYTK